MQISKLMNVIERTMNGSTEIINATVKMMNGPQKLIL